MSDGNNKILEREDRPWGWYQVVLDNEQCKVKLIHVNPNSRLSLQKHLKRSEHWYIVEGELEVHKGMDEVNIIPRKKGEAIKIPQGFWHRAANKTDKPCEFIEIQTGTYFGEDDIIRRQDDYGRV